MTIFYTTVVKVQGKRDNFAFGAKTGSGQIVTGSNHGFRKAFVGGLIRVTFKVTNEWGERERQSCFTMATGTRKGPLPRKPRKGDILAVEINEEGRATRWMFASQYEEAMSLANQKLFKAQDSDRRAFWDSP